MFLLPASRSAVRELLFCAASLLMTIAASAIASAGLPNILLILADDCTFSDLPVYGGANAKTPNLDRLAKQGLTFDRAYLASAMCQPCRAELYTGQFPLRNGCAWNHSASRPSTQSLPHFLEPLGYRVGLAGKVHVAPKKAFPFEEVAGFDPDCTRAPTRTHNLAGVKNFITRDSAQPFCLVVALTEPHVPWVMGDRSAYPPDSLKLPPNLADTQKTREDFAAYLAEITYMDQQVGDILNVLEQAQAAENTLVLFTSEQGSQFPGNKWTCWDTGLHTALIARWPGKIAAGKRTSAMVHYADVAPTLLEVVGTKDLPRSLDGRSFATVLRGEKGQHREYAYGFHNNVPEGPPYPVRSITNGEWRYIRNLTPQEMFIEKHLMGLAGGATIHNPYWPTWLANSEEPATYRLIKRYMHRPADELYHTSADPAELTNLVDKPEHAAVLRQLKTELDRWLAEQQDPGAELDTPAVQKAAKMGEHKFVPKN